MHISSHAADDLSKRCISDE